MTIKYYRKKGTKEITHQVEIDMLQGENSFWIIKLENVGKMFENGRLILGTDNFNKFFLEEDDLEEVVVTFTGKLEAEKIDRALEELKELIARSDEKLKPLDKVAGKILNNISREAIVLALELINLFSSKAQNLVNAMEELSLLRDKDKCKFCNKVFDPNRRTVNSKDPKIWWCSFDCHSQDLIKEKKQSKRDVKLPEVGKRYVDKETKEIMVVKGFTDQVHYSGKMTSNCTDRKDFWDYFEELPEDNIEKPDVELIEVDSKDLLLQQQLYNTGYKCLVFEQQLYFYKLND